MSGPVVNIAELSADERLDLLEQLWDSLSKSPSEIPLTDPQKAELDRRLDELDADVADGSPLGIPWATVLEQIRTKG
jgi:putative addiction module component (TIGR02574 family)